MNERSQINIRIDKELLERLKKKCDREKVSQTEFITKVLKAALGVDDYLLNVEALDERIDDRIHPLEKELENLKTQLDSFKTTAFKK